MASGKNVKVGGNQSRPAAEKDFLDLLNRTYSSEDTKKLWTYSSEDTKNLWNILKDGALEGQGLINLLKGKIHITRMWEKAACWYSEIAHLMAPNDKDLEALQAKTVKANDDVAKKNYADAVGRHADPVVDAMLPQAGKPAVKFIVKRGDLKGGWGSFSFPWAPNSKGFPFKDNFEMTISNGVKPNEYRVRFGGIGGENSNEPKISLFVQRNPNPDSLPRAVKSPVRDNYPPKSCVMAFRFGDAPNQIIVYIRFASPTVLVGKAFKANGKDEGKEKWGDLILAKIN